MRRRLVMLLATIVFTATACDRVVTDITFNADGSGQWTTTTSITRDGVWADNFDELREIAQRTDGDPGAFLQQGAAVVLGDGDEVPEEGADLGADSSLVAALGVRVQVFADRIDIVTAGAEQDYRAMTGDFSLPGTFALDSAGRPIFTIDSPALSLAADLPGAGLTSVAGVAEYSIEVPGRVISHNATEVDGRILRWSFDAREDRLVQVIWDPNDTGGSSGWRRAGLLVIAVVALGIAIAVLLTFRVRDDE